MTAAAFFFRFRPPTWLPPLPARATESPPSDAADAWTAEQDRRDFALGLMDMHPDGFSCGESVIEAMFYLSGRH
ncbi:hypothetical protein ACFO5X_22005 [Seohaeicola nanhaiensis]|uniref:Uncharacterized protein n=1 Tax=Seohaeicola nanhaiensis TaxID=1387282 RepID=A0ABV9KNK5_9RHOB